MDSFHQRQSPVQAPNVPLTSKNGSSTTRTSPPTWAVTEKPIVTYAEDTSIWSSLAGEFNSRLPLRHLSWQGSLRSNRSSSPTTCTIQSLDIDVKPYSHDLLPKYAPGGLHQNSVFLHIYLVGCEDVDYYKNNVRNKLQEWINTVSSKKSQEWMVVHVVEGRTKSRSGIFNIGSTASVFDKIRSDFSLKRDRCMELKLSNSESKDAEVWIDFIDRIKDGLMSSMAQQVAQYEDDTRRLEQQRMMPGWNYCQYFILKEAIAHTYELAKFYEEALLHYDELEATFYQTLTEQGAPWFHKFGGVEPGDDFSDVLNLNRKPYRNMIIQNQITIFDFREYLFSRQCRLILLLQSAADVCHRTKVFAVSFAGTLREYEVSLVPNFRESWLYSLCMRIVCECDVVFNVATLPEHTIQVYEALRAELIQISRLQLDHIGRKNMLYTNPLNENISIPVDTSALSTGSLTDHRPITTPELVLACSSIDCFGELYERITLLSLQGFNASGRSRSALALQADLAFWYFFRGNYERAAELWEALAFKHSETGWHQIEIVIIERLAKCYRELPVSHQGSKLFKVEIVSSTLGIGDNEDVAVDISIESILAKDIIMSMISLILTAGEGKEMQCEGRDIPLHPGKNLISITCPKSTISGLYSPSILVMESGKLHFHCDLTPKDRQKSVRIQETTKSLKMSAKLPGKSENKIVDGRLSISALSNISMLTQSSVLYHITSYTDRVKSTGKDISVNVVDGKLRLPTMNENERITFLLPFKLVQDSRIVEHKMLLSCNADSRRMLHSAIVRVALVHDFIVDELLSFEGDYSLVQFGLRCKEGVALRIISVDATCENHTHVQSLSPFHEQVAFPDAVINLLYKIESPTKTEFNNTTSDRALGLKVCFISLEAEVEAFVVSRLHVALDNLNLAKFTEFILSYVRKHMLSRIDPLEYAAFQTIDFDALDVTEFNSFISDRTLEIQSGLTSAIQMIWDDVRFSTVERVRRESIAPISVMHYTSKHTVPRVVVELMLKPLYTPHPESILQARNHSVELGSSIVNEADIIVGDMLPCILTITPIFWHVATDTIDAEYKVHVDFSVFAMSGKRKQCITLKKGVSSTHQIVLCPLQVGQAIMPNVSINILDSLGGVISEQDISVANISAGLQVAVLPRRQSAKMFLQIDVPSDVAKFMTTTASSGGGNRNTMLVI
ncbi:hypothetical protein BASA61_010562 [Batrachochytrium salamandrivorans]|nr:hypothetical protein BASA61_010562 [Batrachochytrium salamandrivorans]